MAGKLSLPSAISVVVLPFIAFAELNGAFNGPLYQASPLLFWAVDGLFHLILPAASLLFASVLIVSFFLPGRIVWPQLGYPAPSFSYGQVIPSGPLHVPAVLYLSIAAGLVESAVFIGLPRLLWCGVFGNSARRVLFAWASSTVFASVHWEQGPHVVFGAFVFGCIACALQLKIGDLRPIVGAHTAVDVVAFCQPAGDVTSKYPSHPIFGERRLAPPEGRMRGEVNPSPERTS